jgi:DNA-binding PadR family transcriptional regulator
MELPELSHLQCLVIQIIGSGKLTGRELREKLAGAGAAKSGPAFYQMMSRLEESEYVTGEYSQKIVEGQIIKERAYRVTGSGEEALTRALRFYESLRPIVRHPSYV